MSNDCGVVPLRPTRPAVVDDATSIATLHMDRLPLGFLPTLGFRALRRLYRRLVRSDHAFVLVTDDDEGVVGYVAVAEDTRPRLPRVPAARRGHRRSRGRSRSASGAAAASGRPCATGVVPTTRGSQPPRSWPLPSPSAHGVKAWPGGS